MKTPLFALLLVSTVLFSCKKESIESGSGSLRYLSSYEYPITIEPAGFMDRIVVESVNPYSDILGQIMLSANESTTNGKPTKFSEIQVPNIHSSLPIVNILSQQAFIADHLTDSKIIYKYMDSGIPYEVTIATFNTYYDGMIYYNFSNENLASTFKSGGTGSFHIHFDFDSNAAPAPIMVSYELYFDYDYKMKRYKK